CSPPATHALANEIKSRISNTIIEWFKHNKDKLSLINIDFNEGSVFQVELNNNQDGIIVRCKCGTKSAIGQKQGVLMHKNLQTSKDFIISAALLDRYPIIRRILCFFMHDLSEANDFCFHFKRTVIETIIMNHDRAKYLYDYSSSIREFASCVFILGGRNVYEFVRLNIPGLLPSLTVIQALIDASTNYFQEGEFRYNVMSDYISSKKLKFVYAAEDCTSVIPKIAYNTRSNNFAGFVPPLKGCLPQINTFSTESFAELQHWFCIVSMSHLLNVHMIQPATSTSDSCAPFLLSAYGTDNCFTAQDIVLRWVNIVNECTKNRAKLVGFATDCDSRYLGSMRLLMGFFSNMPKQQFHQHENAFHVDIPQSWSWFYMRNKQLTLFFQDSVHIYTKLRNRMLSSTTTMLIGDQAITVDHLLQLIKSSSKMSHNLVKSDVIPKDRQNYQSCEKISSEAAFNALTSVPNSRATQIYLQVCLLKQLK
ncbi:unnamed protein product, partial [Rotaria socialis]